MENFIDLHNHSTWSDGDSTPEQIIVNAINKGINIIGISDHYSTIKCPSVYNEELREYMKEINALKEKYKEQIKVLCGIEICTRSSWRTQEELPLAELNELDYVLIEYVDYFSDSIRFKDIKQFTKGITVQRGLAHTSLVELGETYGFEEVLKVLQEENIFWELNVNESYELLEELLNYIRIGDTGLKQAMDKYPMKVTVGSDTHILDCYSLERVKAGNEIIESMGQKAFSEN